MESIPWFKIQDFVRLSEVVEYDENAMTAFSAGPLKRASNTGQR